MEYRISAMEQARSLSLRPLFTNWTISRRTHPRKNYGVKSPDHPDKRASMTWTKTSVYSFFMEKDFRYYFQHPYFRLIVAYLVTFCNFLIYAEDPVAHSEAECFIPVVGNTFSFVVTKYPKNAWALLKVIMWLLAILVGLIVGKVFIHKVVFSKFDLFFL